MPDPRFDTTPAILAALAVPTPTRAEAQQALDLLDGVFRGVRFTTPGDRARAIAFLLTCSARATQGLMPTSPAWLMPTGRPVPPIASAGRHLASNRAEYLPVSPDVRHDLASQRKVAAAVWAHPGYAHFVHIPVPTRGQLTTRAMSSLVTSPDGSVCFFRAQSDQPVPISGVIVTISGVDFTATETWPRRILPIEVDSQGLPPLAERVAMSRPALLDAAHAILVRALRQQLVPPRLIGSFEAWSSLVLGGLSDLNLAGESRPVAELVLDGWTEWKEQLEARSTRTEAA